MIIAYLKIAVESATVKKVTTKMLQMVFVQNVILPVKPAISLALIALVVLVQQISSVSILLLIIVIVWKDILIAERRNVRNVILIVLPVILTSKMAVNHVIQMTIENLFKYQIARVQEIIMKII